MGGNRAEQPQSSKQVDEEVTRRLELNRVWSQMHLIIGSSHNGTLGRPLSLPTNVCLPRSHSKRRSKNRRSSALNPVRAQVTSGNLVLEKQATQDLPGYWLSSRGTHLSCGVLVISTTPTILSSFPSTQRTFPPSYPRVLFAPYRSSSWPRVF